MKLYDKETGEIVGTIITNRNMTIEEALELVKCEIDEEGQIMNYKKELLNAWYENLEMNYEED